jgi:hypothetical protein
VLDVADSIADSSVVLARITRPLRYSLYRAGDGWWYLGIRTWNPATAQFNGVQPTAGPYAPPGRNGSRIEYFDSAGNAISSGTPDTRGIARIEWLLATVPRGTTPGVPDSVRIVVAPRNRR